ncbi:DUF3037 domain-containing protein [bacterium]|nr:MAG: DUF3037 domain-containing protein [bacterium]
MIAYEYQQLLLFPDLKSGEFVNVGFVIKEKGSDSFDFQIISSMKRIQHVFEKLNIKTVQLKMQSIEYKLNSLKLRLDQESFIPKWASILDITEVCLVTDDSALQFGKVNSGIDISLQSASFSLRKRFLEKWMLSGSAHSVDDETVWRTTYRKYFKEKGIEDKLVEKTFKTNHDTLSFSHAFKNGAWNCFLPINLDLIKSESIKKKAYSWVGKCDELSDINSPIKIFFLAAMPSIHEDLNSFIESKFNLKNDKIECRLIKKPNELQPVLDELIHK